MYLTFGGDIKLDTFEIQQECSSWYHHNVKVHERKQRKLFSNHYYHEYKGKQVLVISVEMNHHNKQTYPNEGKRG